MIKKTIEQLKKIQYKHFISVTFILLLFYLASSTFNNTLINITDLIKDDEESYKIRISEFVDKVDEEYLTMLNFEDHFLKNKGSFINLNGYMSKIMGQRYMNDRIKLKNGNLTNTIEQLDILPAITQMDSLYKKQKEKGKHFLFVLAPFQISKYEDLLPSRLNPSDFSNENSDKFIDEMHKLNIPVLDLREELKLDGISHSEAFYKTDHHWKAETGFWAYTKIVNYFTENNFMKKIDSKYTDYNEYNIVSTNDYFLGTHGKRTGKYFAGTDEFSYIYPKFHTNLSVKVKSRGISKTGEFIYTNYNQDPNEYNHFLSSYYSNYGYGSVPQVEHKNELAPNSIKILSIGDSFSAIPFSFLSLIASSSDRIDMRYYEEDFESYYNSLNPNIVVVLINPSQLIKENTTYEFFDK